MFFIDLYREGRLSMSVFTDFVFSPLEIHGCPYNQSGMRHLAISHLPCSNIYPINKSLQIISFIYV